MELKRGFSLIELTVVIGLLSLLTLAITSALLMSVVSSNRIRTVTRVKQAGNYALDQIQGLVRNSKKVVLCVPNTSVAFINPDGGTTTISSTTQIASNSGVFLTPSNLTVSNFALSCTPNNTAPALISVAFDLHNPENTSLRESPTLHFETAINLRND